MPRVEEAWQLHLVLENEESVARNRNSRNSNPAFHLGAAWDAAKVLRDKLLHGCRIKITGDGKRCVVGGVIRLEEVLDVGQRRSTEVCHRTDYRPRIRM